MSYVWFYEDKSKTALCKDLRTYNSFIYYTWTQLFQILSGMPFFRVDFGAVNSSFGFQFDKKIYYKSNKIYPIIL